MKSLLYYICVAMALISLGCVSGCADSAADRLAAASRLVASRPDSAYTILRDIDYDALDADSLKARYILTRAWANVGVGRSLITDTLLNEATTYYLAVGDTSNWVIASQLLSSYDFRRGDMLSGLCRLKDMASHIKNPALLWDTYIGICEGAFHSADYDDAYRYADWLLRHTTKPEDILRFGAAKGAARYYQGNHTEALGVFDSIMATGVTERVSPGIAKEFYGDYAEILNGSGRPHDAIRVTEGIYPSLDSLPPGERISAMMSLADFYANAGDTRKAVALLDSLDRYGTQSVFDIYASIAMLRTAIEFKETGHIPGGLMHEVTRNMARDYRMAQFDSQTAMESVIELNDDNYELKLQRQRLWLLLSAIALIVVVSGVVIYIMLSRRKRRMVEAEERAEMLELMLKDAQKADEDKSTSSASDKLKAALLRQLGIFKTFAGIPTQQSRDALRKISSIDSDGASIETLVDWKQFYQMIDSLYDNFHTRLTTDHPGVFNDKEQQIIVLLKAGFSTKEIGVLTEQSSATIYTRKSVIRKKLNITEDSGDIIAHIEGYATACPR